MLNTGWPEKTDPESFRGLRLKVEPVDDYCDIPDNFILSFSNPELTSEGFRERLVYGCFPDVRFPEDL